MSPLNLYASVPFLAQLAHATAGAARTPAPPRPLFGRKVLAQLGRHAPRGCEGVSYRVPCAAQHEALAK